MAKLFTWLKYNNASNECFQNTTVPWHTLLNGREENGDTTCKLFPVPCTSTTHHLRLAGSRTVTAMNNSVFLRGSTSKRHKCLQSEHADSIQVLQVGGGGLERGIHTRGGGEGGGWMGRGGGIGAPPSVSET